jgi:hypothetical protein
VPSARENPAWDCGKQGSRSYRTTPPRMPTFTYCPSRKATGFNVNGAKMPKETHTKAAEHHESAAKAHRTAGSITGRANTIRAMTCQRRLTNIPPKLIVTQPTPTGRAANTGRRNRPRARTRRAGRRKRGACLSAHPGIAANRSLKNAQRPIAQFGDRPLLSEF